MVRDRLPVALGNWLPAVVDGVVLAESCYTDQPPQGPFDTFLLEVGRIKSGSAPRC